MSRVAYATFAAIVLLCCHLWAGSWSEERSAYVESQQQAADHISKLLTESELIELLSLDPFPPSRRPDDPGDHVGRNRVRMRVLLREKERIPSVVMALKASLAASVAESFPEAGQQVYPPGCFLPQHGFRVLREGKEVYVLICYLCSTGQIIGLGDVPIEFHTTSLSRGIVEELFLDSGLPAAEKKYPQKANQASEPTR